MFGTRHSVMDSILPLYRLVAKGTQPLDLTQTIG